MAVPAKGRAGLTFMGMQEKSEVESRFGSHEHREYQLAIEDLAHRVAWLETPWYVKFWKWVKSCVGY